MDVNRLFIGDVRDGLRSFAPRSAQMCVTSPPYWGLRDYGCEGQIGLEPTFAEYVATMVEVFRLVRDALADDGTLWLNLGDSYATSPAGNKTPSGISQNRPARLSVPLSTYNTQPKEFSGLKPKDLCGIPWRVAFALQADGWYLRSDIIWHKPNPMPESVTDRPTKAHEYLFLFAKSEKYFYDAAAIAEPAAWERWGDQTERKQHHGTAGHLGGKTLAELPIKDSKNRRTVWTIATEAYADAHFATFPTALVEPCIAAGTSERGHCPKCGKGWERVVEREKSFESGSGRSGNPIAGKQDLGAAGTNSTPDIRMGPTIATRTLGWQPACDCSLDPVPGVVLDPFMGSGTVAQVAQSLGRKWIGCELNPEYARMVEQRSRQRGLELYA